MVSYRNLIYKILNFARTTLRYLVVKLVVVLTLTNPYFLVFVLGFRGAKIVYSL